MVTMHRNKLRLQLALYARPKHPGTYHYALFISSKGPKKQIVNSATKYHVKNTLRTIAGKAVQDWRFERVDVSNILLEHRLLVRIVIAKMTSTDAFESILEAVPIYQVNDPNQVHAQSFSCLTWVRAALEELRNQGAVVKLREWDSIQKNALEYVERKIKEGRWNGVWAGEAGVPTLDLLSGKEIVL
jgi:hypothetical protein